jgi:hypothetical protein
MNSSRWLVVRLRDRVARDETPHGLKAVVLMVVGIERGPVVYIQEMDKKGESK